MTSAYGISPGLRLVISRALRSRQLHVYLLNNDTESPLVVNWMGNDYVLIAIPKQRYLDEVTDPIND